MTGLPASPIDIHSLPEYRPVWPKCDLTDFSKLDVRDGKIHFALYQQDGSMQEMACADTYQNRLYVSWIQIHDRHTVADRAEIAATLSQETS